VTDPFALLNEPRRPWVDPDALHAKFLALSATQHPDRFHNADAAEREAARRRFAELNVAYQCLRDPGQRLRRLLELETGVVPAKLQTAPADLLPLFVEVGEACREAGAFLSARSPATSPVLKAVQFGQALEWTGRLQGLLGRLHDRQAALLEELRALNPLWEATPGVPTAGGTRVRPLERLEEICRTLGFLIRWTAQIQEHLVQLAL
jgi:DnaJ-domain-containing protein 1